MASRTLVEYVDDLDGTASDKVAPVEFGLDGVTYSIDLSEGNAGHLRDTLSPYVVAGRRTGGRKHVATPLAPVARSKDQTKAIRDWAQANGHTISNRGRIPTEVLDAYEGAHAERPAASGKTRRSRAK